MWKDLKDLSEKERCRGWVGMKLVKAVRRYKLPVVKEISPGHVMYSLVIIVNNTLLHY